MESHRVLIKSTAVRELDAIASKRDRQRMAHRIGRPSSDPRPPGCQKLAGMEERYRARQCRYRIVYAVDDRERTVVVFRIGHRKDVDR